MYKIISTHSLTRRLTKSCSRGRNTETISTHSLTRRLTARTQQIRQKRMHFNSQPHKEADNEYGGSVEREVISTHSLTRRLTGLCDLLLN